MAKEEHHGPIELVGLGKQTNEANDSDSEDDLVQAQDSEAEEGDDYHMEKLRQYQLNRLRYFYAVVECDSAATADKIYKECDGNEYESSATRIDLRFIPDETTFDDDVPTDVCTQLPDTHSYKPRQFTTTALQQVKVDLTWDETAVERQELGDKLTSGKLDEIDDKDLRKLVAYSSEEEEEDEEQETKQPLTKKAKEVAETSAQTSEKGKKHKKKDAGIDKYKALLAEINEKEKQEKNKKYEMEFSWEINNKGEKNDQEKEEEEEEGKEKPTAKVEQLTPIEKVMKKRSEKNKQRKEERKRRRMLAEGLDPDAADNSESDSIPDGIDLNDPYFAEEFAGGDFVDTQAKKKQTAKQKRQNRTEQDMEEEKKAQELALLLDDDDDVEGDKQHFSLDKIQKAEQETKSKRKRRKLLKKSKSSIAEERRQQEDNFEVNVNDDRFKALFTSHLFNIDPTDSHFKKTKGMEKLIHEKFKRRSQTETGYDKNILPQNVQGEEVTVTEVIRPKKRLENTLLVKSLKRKLQMK